MSAPPRRGAAVRAAALMARLSPAPASASHASSSSSASASGSRSASSAPSSDSDGFDDDEVETAGARKRRLASPKRRAAAAEQRAPGPSSTRTPSAPPKRRRTGGGGNDWAFLDAEPWQPQRVAVPPLREHGRRYHAPLLLAPPEAAASAPSGALLGLAGRTALLQWYDGVSLQRRMPWRKPWLDPAEFSEQGEAALREAQTQRAYEVWISEIMLQQTRVETVVPYFERWLAKWPSVRDLAAASHDDVLAVWKGLGYYSRATRLQAGAQKVVGDPKLRGLLPRTATELIAVVPGVGPYTAGAISAIAFGEAAPMVDGNVQRVLSRQLGLYASMKSSATTQLLHEVAARLVQAVAEDGAPERPEGTPAPPSDRPGRWGQALMELGATICKPKPECARCPISSTCRAYAEGEALASQGQAPLSKQEAVPDIEDLCDICEPLSDDEEVDVPAVPAPAAARKKSGGGVQTKLSFGGKPVKPEPSALEASAANAAKEAIVERHVKRFPRKTEKKQARLEQCCVCVMRRDDGGSVLLEQRPDHGLLASLFEFPAAPLSDADLSASKQRALALSHAAHVSGGRASYVRSVGSVTHLFSHIRLVMHVHELRIAGAPASPPGERRRWVAPGKVEEQSISTGNARCWALAQGTTKGKKGK